MSEITSRPATPQYYEGWERAFGEDVEYATGAEKARVSASASIFPPRSNSASASAATAESPESPVKVDGSGPTLFPIQVKCPACNAAPYEDCCLISADASAVASIYVSYIHDARRKVASEARAD
jgi:hypothetical protein